MTIDGLTYEAYEAEQERLKRLDRRRKNEDESSDLPFVTVPDDYGTHDDFIYFGRNNDE